MQEPVATIPHSCAVQRFQTGLEYWKEDLSSQSTFTELSWYLLEWNPLMPMEGTWDGGRCPCAWQGLELDEL